MERRKVMSQQLKILLFFIVLLLGTACFKDKSPTDPTNDVPIVPPATNSFIQAFVKQDNFSINRSEFLYATYQTGSGNISLNASSVQYETSSNTFFMNIKANAVGTYTNSQVMPMYYRINSIPVWYFMANSQDLKVVITRFDAVGGRIEGTFLVRNAEFSSNGSILRYVTVTNGSFSMKRVQDDFTPP